MVLDPSSGGVLSIEEVGIGSHVGKFTLFGESDSGGVLSFTVTAASGDQFYGRVVGGTGNTVELALEGGTGRFLGLSGNVTATLTVDPIPVSLDPLTMAYTATAVGEISTVGSSKH
jgi:hypothetical protein